MTRTRRRRWHAIALLAGREVFRKHSENSVHQKVREECPLLVRLGTLIHPNQMPAQGRVETPADRCGQPRIVAHSMRTGVRYRKLCGRPRQLNPIQNRSGQATDRADIGKRHRHAVATGNQSSWCRRSVLVVQHPARCHSMRPVMPCFHDHLLQGSGHRRYLQRASVKGRPQGLPAVPLAGGRKEAGIVGLG